MSDGYESIPVEGVEAQPRRDEFTRWLYEDCTVVECIEGNIYKLVAGNPTLYNCPVCRRTAVTPGQRIWTGKVTLRTKEEMDKRFEERMYLTKNRHARYDRAKELAVMLHTMLTPKKQEVAADVQSMAGGTVGVAGASPESKEEDPF